MAERILAIVRWRVSGRHEVEHADVARSGEPGELTTIAGRTLGDGDARRDELSRSAAAMAGLPQRGTGVGERDEDPRLQLPGGPGAVGHARPFRGGTRGARAIRFPRVTVRNERVAGLSAAVVERVQRLLDEREREREAACRGTRACVELESSRGGEEGQRIREESQPGGVEVRVSAIHAISLLAALIRVD